MSTSRIHPLTGAPRNGHARKELFALARPSRRAQRASYDAARDSDEFKNYWANADSYDADSANRQEVRRKLVSRSRYEVGNNGYSDGIHATLANYVVGLGPSLRMQSRIAGFNQAVEAVFRTWAAAIGLRRKLWCAAHAKVQDGESFALLVNNFGLNHRVKLDLQLLETEQCTTPFLPLDTAGYIDGIKFDSLGNPQWYDLLDEHPGSDRGSFFAESRRVPAEQVLHWFKLRRPGQHRGVPEFSSTLNVGAASRRFREATVGAAESAAEVAALLKTGFQPDEMDQVSPMSTVEYEKRMLMALPMGWDAQQMKAEHPNAEYAEFLRTQLSETGRPKSVPFNLAAMDSSSYSFASGKLDHLTFFGSIDIERADCNELMMDRIFARWWPEAVLEYGWNPGDGQTPRHSWDWPRHPIADVKGEAEACGMRLRNGTTSLSRVYSDAGLDYEDELEQMALDYGVTTDEMRHVLRRNLFGAAADEPQTILPGDPAGAEEDEELAEVKGR